MQFLSYACINIFMMHATFFAMQNTEINCVAPLPFKTIDNEYPIETLCFTLDNTKLITGSSCAADASCIRIYDVCRLDWHYNEIKDLKQVLAVAAHPQNHQIVANSDGVIVVLDLELGSHIVSMYGHVTATKISSLNYNQDGKAIVSSGHDKTVKLWDVRTKQSILSFSHEGIVSCAQWRPGDLQVASTSADKTIRLWDLRMSNHALIKRNSVQSKVAYNSSGTQFVSCGSHINLYNSNAALFAMYSLYGKKEEDKSSRISRSGTMVADSLAFMPKSDDWVAAHLTNGEVTICNLEDSTQSLFFTAEKKEGACAGVIAFSADSERFVMGSYGEKNIRIWNTADIVNLKIRPKKDSKGCIIN